MAADRRLRWLGALAIVALAAVMAVRSMGQSPATPAGRPAAATRAAGARAPAAAATEAADVRLEALTRPRGEPVSRGRNPFRFQPKPLPPPPPAPTRPAQGAETAPPLMTPAGPPPPPPIPLKFIGLVEKADGTRIAVLSDGRRPHSGVEGQAIDGRYRILKIGNESIEIAYLDGRGRQTIRLTGQ